MKRLLPAGMLLWSALVSAQTNEPQAGMRLLAHQFSDYTILLAAGPDEPWRASWNDSGQMAMLENPSNNVVITSQYLKFPPDIALAESAGNRDAYLDVALRKYCAVQMARSGDWMVRTQEIKIHGTTLGKNSFRYCPILGHDRQGPRRGYFYIMLRGATSHPKFDGDTLIFTIGYPEGIAGTEEQRALKTFEVMLQNVSFP